MRFDRKLYWLSSAGLSILLYCAVLSAQQARPTPRAQAAADAQQAANAPVPSEAEVASTQTQLIKLLRLSPTLTTVVSHDPSLLSDHEYVARNNPQLAEFLSSHPDVARNPQFYLFSHLNRENGQPDEALERAVWPDVYRIQERRSPFAEFLSDLSPLLAFVAFLVAVVWMTRVFIENRRWSRIFKLQSEVHGKLIDKFTSNQDLAVYMETEAGKRFLEAAPIPVGLENNRNVPNAVARVLTPLQVGVVLVLLGAGFLSLRHASPDMNLPMLVLGTVTLMPGAGFIISAGLTWLLAARLGLMPTGPNSPQSIGAPYISPDHQ